MARVLVVDDNLLEGRGVAAAALVLGHHALHVTTLALGLRAAKEGDWDLIFLDFSLPDGDGLEALEAFAASSPGAAVVALVSEREEQRAVTARGRGLAAHLLRPVSPLDAAEVLERMVPAKARSAPAGQGAVDSPPGVGPALESTAPLPLLKEFRDAAERRYLEVLLEKTGGDVPRALDLAGISRAGYYNLLKKHGLTSGHRDEEIDA